MRSFKLVVLGIVLSVGSLFASEVRLKDGTIYQNVKILDRDAQTIRLAVPHGEVKLDLQLVESIDGVKVEAPASIAAPAEPVAPPIPATAAKNPVQLPALLPSPAYVHRWTMDIFLLLLGVAITAWITALVWVQYDVKGTPKEIRRINAEVLLLPVVGFLLYLVRRQRRSPESAVTRTLTGRVAGLKPDEVPKKRGLFSGRTKIAAILTAKKRRVGMDFLDVDGNPIQIRKDMPEMTGIEAAREVLEEAMSERASDVHLEPQADGCRVRYRIDGALQERMTFARADGLRVVAALKTLAQIDVAEKRKAQDGRFRVRTGNGEVDFRAATTSAIHGEKLVLRILDRKSGVMSLGELGMSQGMMERFDHVIHSRNGIILATGPTGSGKTSTLYAALSRLDRKQLNIMSIEDPVEYELEGATQIPVNVKAGVSYEAGLRSILRQDPDVIFVGEMRDAEAAKITVRAALTGHLVFSSLHAKHCVGTIVRLVDIGVERYQIASALLMVVAQRLVRVLCKECREAYVATGTELHEVGLALTPGSEIYRAVGCESCDHTGYQGRTGVFELLVMDEELRRAVTDSVDEQTLFVLASEKGLRSYYDDGADKVLSGITSVEEVLRAS
ncbi:MAG TPA: GspE/PulE family protein [Verrucomicrobiae bacterium]|nr:GspE/PulE family protein [Verrucomicrobiae bacterium]